MSTDKKLEILKVKKENDVMHPKDVKLNKILPIHSFIMLLIAPPKSGKSNLVGNILCNSNLYGLNYWDEILYFSPTAEIDKTTSSFLGKMDNVTIMSDHNDLLNMDQLITAIIDEQKATKKEDRERKLLVFDDCIGYFDKSPILGHLATRYRHYDLSIILCSQQYKKIPLIMRNCATALIYFNLGNQVEFNKIFDEFGRSFGENYNEITQPYLKQKYSFIFINIEDQKVYHNFDTLLLEK